MKAKHYKQELDNEWFELSTYPYHKIACCDCGLVHLVEFKEENGKYYMRAVRDNRATGQRRRRNRENLWIT